jgi:hypothetical protein
MSTKLLAGVALVLLATGLATGRTDNPTDGEEFKVTSLASLEGTWVKISVVYNGATNGGDGQWVFRGGHMTSTSGDGPPRAIHRVSQEAPASRNPDQGPCPMRAGSFHLAPPLNQSRSGVALVGFHM